jgi:hypothetical protein
MPASCRCAALERQGIGTIGVKPVVSDRCSPPPWKAFGITLPRAKGFDTWRATAADRGEWMPR